MAGASGDGALRHASGAGGFNAGRGATEQPVTAVNPSDSVSSVRQARDLFKGLIGVTQEVPERLCRIDANSDQRQARYEV